ncbi:aminoacyl-tRNA hydrolase [Candidatus Daviesbacteria bacterium]|nr:aminoacyl-tRNA hydrolase [Candidatus Daviesbacteria bacterium]
MKLIVGLGNPGEKYQSSRHNLGFRVVDELAKRIKQQESSWEYKDKLKSEILQLSLILNSYSLSLIFAKPLTFMNNSGLAVKLLTTYYKLPATDLIIIYDDLDLRLGQIKVRTGGAAAGHHGVESIIQALGTDQFTRVRLGIGNQKSHSGEHQRVHFDADKFVMEPFEPDEKSQVKHMIKQVVDILMSEQLL